MPYANYCSIIVADCCLVCYIHRVGNTRVVARMVTTFSSRLFGPRRGFDLPFVDQLWAGSGVALDLAHRQLMRPHFEAPTMCDLQFSEMPG